MISARRSSLLRLLARNEARRRLLAALKARPSTAEIAANALGPRTVFVAWRVIACVWHNSGHGARLFHTSRRRPKVNTRRSGRTPNSVRVEPGRDTVRLCTLYRCLDWPLAKFILSGCKPAEGLDTNGNEGCKDKQIVDAHRSYYLIFLCVFVRNKLHELSTQTGGERQTTYPLTTKKGPPKRPLSSPVLRQAQDERPAAVHREI
jgi:hypothetical protein